MKRFLPILFIHLFHFSSFSQEIPLKGDCRDAVEISPKGKHAFSNSPIGSGEVLDISQNWKGPKHYFQQEHNTAWFYFDALTDDQLVFKIYPKDTAADFDFMLYQYSDDDFCNNLNNNTLKPIRTNISRNNPQEYSATGLSVGAPNTRVPAGPGNHWSRALKPQKGERYYLVIDNENGVDCAWSLTFEYYTTTKVSGIVKDEETGYVLGNATVSWEEKNGEVLADVMTDRATGKYSFYAPVKKGRGEREYVLAVSKPSHLFTEQIVIASDKKPVVELKTILPKLAKGKRMILRNILFHGGRSTPLPSSKPSFRRLYKLMKLNPNLEIKIEGHTNGCSKGVEDSQILSERRAARVKFYLTERGITPSRITTEGFNCTRMLAKLGEEEVSMGGHNRRVEFIVVNY